MPRELLDGLADKEKTLSSQRFLRRSPGKIYKVARYDESSYGPPTMSLKSRMRFVDAWKRRAGKATFDEHVFVPVGTLVLYLGSMYGHRARVLVGETIVFMAKANLTSEPISC